MPLVAAAALTGGAKYAGKTEDGHSVTLNLTSDAGRVKRMRIHYAVTCDDGRSGGTYTDILNPKIRSDRTFKGAGTYEGSGDGSTNKFHVAGKISKSRASGTFSLTATSDSGTEGGTLTCETGKISWSVKRR